MRASPPKPVEPGSMDFGASEACRDTEIELLALVRRLLDNRIGVVDAQRPEGRRPDQAGADRSAPLHAGAGHRQAGSARSEVVLPHCRSVREYGAAQSEALRNG